MLKSRTFARSLARLGAVSTAALVAAPAFAQSTNPIVQMIESVGLDGIVAAVVAMGLIIVSIALAFKGPDVAKRGVKKV